MRKKCCINGKSRTPADAALEKARYGARSSTLGSSSVTLQGRNVKKQRR